MVEAAPLISITKSVQPQAIDEFLWGQKDHLDTITAITNVLHDADSRQAATDDTVLGWLARLRVVLGEANDSLDKEKKGTEIGKKVLHLISTVGMHDLMHDLVTKVAGSESITSFFELKSMVDNTFFGLMSLTSFLCPWGTSFRKNVFNKFMSGFRSLRVLDLPNPEIQIVPACIGELIYLRFLRLHLLYMEMFPSSIRNLRHLRYLSCQGGVGLSANSTKVEAGHKGKEIREPKDDDIAGNINRLNLVPNRTELDPTPSRIGRKQAHYTKLKWQTILDKKKLMLKWMFILLNVGLELCQATFSQEAGNRKIKGSQYRKLAVIFSAICLTLSLLELVQQGRRDGVKWSRNRGCYCFHYPGRGGRIFGRFPLWFGLISAALQFSLNLASLLRKGGVFHFDPLGLLLSVGYFFSALLGGRTAMVAKVRCDSHGSNEAVGKLVQGVWEFRCHECLPEKMV